MNEIPSSRWRTDGAAPEGRSRPASKPAAADRVRRSHAQTRVTLRLALGFIAAAALSAAAVDARWLPLHLFLAGGMVLAISGVSLMLTVTWSAAPAPSDRWVAWQRVAVAVGAAGVGIGREAELADAVVGVSGALYVAGLVTLAGLLVVTIRQGVERRFDVAVAAYVLALTAGVVAVGVGIVMAVDGPTVGLRATHVTLNVLGLVGLVAGGTMPFFAATVGRSRLAGHATPRRMAAVLGWQVLALVVAAAGLAGEVPAAAAAGLGAYALGIVGVLALLPRPTKRQLDWAGPRLLGLWAGGAWWSLAVAVTAVEAGRDESILLGGRWLLVLVVAGYGQILWGSLAYVVPMLRGGGHERLGEGFAVTRSWLGLGAANAAGIALASDLTPVAWVLGGVWVLDTAWRLGRVQLSAG